MRFNQEFIEKVRQSNNIVDVIAQYTELKRAGGNFMGRCPFPDHSDKSPSFSVSEDRQLYHCFGCKKGGTIFTFLETFQGLSFPEAIEFLAKRASIPLPEPEEKTNTRFREKKSDREFLLRVNRLAGVFFYRQLKSLPSDHIAKKYVASRGLTDEIVDKFKIGVGLEDWQGLANVLEEKRVPAKMAESLGLIRPKKSGQGFFDLFRERIMFPIFSPSEELLGFGGRTYLDALPKYLNSPESDVFHKGRVLYGLHETGKYIRSQDRAVIVEGYMDTVALYRAGVTNVAAILGTAFTADHAKLLKRYTLNVVMLLDGDAAGIQAAERSLPILMQEGIFAKGCVLPEGLDPDEFVEKHGVEKLKQMIDAAPDLFNVMLGRWLEGYRGSPSEKVQIVGLAAPTLLKMKNAQLRDLYLLELARQLDVDQPWVRRTLAGLQAEQEKLKPIQAKSVGGATATEVPPAPSLEQATVVAIESQIELTRVSLKGAPRDEVFVLSMALSKEYLLQAVISGLDLVHVTHDGVRQIMNLAIEKYRQNPSIFDSLGASLASQIDNPSLLTTSFELLREEMGEEEHKKLMNDYMMALSRRFLKDKAKALVHQLRGQSSQETLEQFMNVLRDRHSLDRE